MAKEIKRSLYDCFLAKVNGERIYCAAGYKLGSSGDGDVHINRLVRGQPLVFAACQNCGEFDQMDGGPVVPSERGWLHLIRYKDKEKPEQVLTTARLMGYHRFYLSKPVPTAQGGPGPDGFHTPVLAGSTPAPATKEPAMKRSIKINPQARVAYIPKDIIDQGLSGDVDGYANAVTLTMVKPGTPLKDVERSLKIVLKDIQFRREREENGGINSEEATAESELPQEHRDQGGDPEPSPPGE